MSRKKLEVILVPPTSRARGALRLPKKRILEWVSFCEKKLKQKKILCSGVLTLAFLSKKDARALNLEFRGKDYATDVLSFEPLEEGDFGELVMCLDVLKKQAKQQGHSLSAELEYMILHGILHLLGYDHEQGEKEAREMFQLQDEIYFSARPSRSKTKA